MQKTIGIFTIKVPGLNPWDPDSIHRGISGSEEAVIYASQELAKLGHRVFVFNEPPQGSVHSFPEANPRFINYLPNQIHFDVIIVCRAPEIIEYLKNRAKKFYFWPQDTCSHRIREEIIHDYDDVFWISSWQRSQWILVNPAFAKFGNIFGNAVQLNQFQQPQERSNPYSCIYASNYGRGLSVLLDAWPHVKNKYAKATLDIYYGWQHWGAMSESQERNLRYQIADLQKLDVKDHGLIGHEELSRAFSRASFWTYPCIHAETFCITAIKAQLAGAFPIIIDGSALTEVVRHGFKCLHRQDYKQLLCESMNHAETISLKERSNMGEFVKNEFSWEKMVSRWDKIFV